MLTVISIICFHIILRFLYILCIYNKSVCIKHYLINITSFFINYLEEFFLLVYLDGFPFLLKGCIIVFHIIAVS